MPLKKKKKKQIPNDSDTTTSKMTLVDYLRVFLPTFILWIQFLLFINSVTFKKQFPHFKHLESDEWTNRGEMLHLANPHHAYIRKTGLLTERSIFRFSYGSHTGKMSSWYMDKYTILKEFCRSKILQINTK